MTQLNDIDLLENEIEIYECALDTEFLESGLFDAVTMINKAISSIIVKMQQFVENLKSDITLLVSKHQTRKKLQEIRSRAADKVSSGSTKKYKVNVPDFKKINNLYGKGIKELSKKTEKLLKMNVKDENGLESFDKKCEDLSTDFENFESLIEEELDRKIEVDPKEIVDYIDSLLSGRNAVYDRYYQLINQFQHLDINSDAELRMKGIKNSTISAARRKKTLLVKFSASASNMMKKIVFTTALVFG